MVTADVTAYTASLASAFIGPMVSYTALAIQVSLAVADTVRNMPRDPEVSTDQLENLVGRPFRGSGTGTRCAGVPHVVVSRRVASPWVATP